MFMLKLPKTHATPLLNPVDYKPWTNQEAKRMTKCKAQGHTWLFPTFWLSASKDTGILWTTFFCEGTNSEYLHHVHTMPPTSSNNIRTMAEQFVQYCTNIVRTCTNFVCHCTNIQFDFSLNQHLTLVKTNFNSSKSLFSRMSTQLFICST